MLCQVFSRFLVHGLLVRTIQQKMPWNAHQESAI